MFKYIITIICLACTHSFAESKIITIKQISDITSKIDDSSWVFINLDKFITGTKGVYQLKDGDNLKKFLKNRSSKVPVYGITARGGSHHPQYMSFLRSAGVSLSDLPKSKKDKSLKSDYFKVRDNLIYVNTEPMHPSLLGKTLAHIYKQVDKAPQKFVFIGHDYEDAHSALTVQNKKLKFSTDVYQINSNQKTTLTPIKHYSDFYKYVQPGDWVFTDVDETLLVHNDETEVTVPVDPFSVRIVRMLQDKVPVFALTARTTEKLPQVLNRINKIGINFTISQQKLALPNIDRKGFRYPNQSFNSGVIFASKPRNFNSVKGQTLRHFIESLQLPDDLKPKRIIFVDNRKEDIESVAATDFGIPKHLFHFQYTEPAELNPAKRPTVDALTDPDLPKDRKTRKAPHFKYSADDDNDDGEIVSDEDASEDLD